MKRVTASFFTLPAVAMLLLSGCGNAVKEYEAVNTAMGTVVTQKLYTEGDDVTGDVEQLLSGMEETMLSRRIAGSEVAKLNANAGTGIYTEVSGELAETLLELSGIYEDSDGALDVSIGALVSLWNIDAHAQESYEDAGEQPDGTGGKTEDAGQTESTGKTEGYRLPGEAEIKEALSYSGFSKIERKDNSFLLPKGMALDLGAVGKGLACDDILAYLEGQAEVKAAVISVGGSILTYGEKPDGTAFRVAITDPFDTGAYCGYLTLTGNWFVSTSGDYERFVEVDGKRYHHILNPATGYPAESGVKSVTILSKNGMTSDALSTACFVLGEEKGRLLAEKYGVEALFISEDGNISMTKGMQEYFTEQTK